MVTNATGSSAAAPSARATRYVLLLIVLVMLLNTVDRHIVAILVDDIKLVQMKRVELLGTNKIDRERAAKTPEISEAYGMAVAVLRGDV